jgi:hypothetical protein
MNWEQSANVLFRLSSVSPAHHTPLGPAVVAGPRAAHYGHSCVSLRSMSLSSHAKTPSSVLPVNSGATVCIRGTIFHGIKF